MRHERNSLRNLALVTQLSLNIIITTLICLYIGIKLDNFLGTRFLSVTFLIFGILGGAKSAYTIAMKATEADVKKERTPEEIVARYNEEHGGKKL